MKRFVLIHGWEGGPDKGWFPWLSKELEARGYAVVAPALPEPEEPRIERWVPAITTAVGTPDAETYLVAHSIGCQATLRYLESLPDGAMLGGAVFVAGFLNPLTNLEGPEEEELAASWTDAPLDTSRAASHLPKSIALFSDNDEWVSLDNVEAFRDRIGSETSVEHGRGHFTKKEEPAVLKAVLKLVS